MIKRRQGMRRAFGRYFSPRQPCGPDFGGTFGRLLLLAGPSGCGKSTFLQRPRDYLAPSALLPHLRDLYTLAETHVDITKLGAQPAQHYEQLCLHVDITQPVRWHRPLARSRQELLSLLQPDLFRHWQQLQRYLREASEVDVITLFVRRKVHFSRWIFDKGLAHQNVGKERQEVIAIYGDSGDDSVLHRRLYQAWHAYLTGLPIRSSTVLDANGASYHVLEERDFTRQLRAGYAHARATESIATE